MNKIASRGGGGSCLKVAQKKKYILGSPVRKTSGRLPRDCLVENQGFFIVFHISCMKYCTVAKSVGLGRPI